jgi:Ca2+-binding RTX toxin-like protein
LVFRWTGTDVLEGGGGDDNLSGYNGDDVPGGGLGADWLSGGEGADTFVWNSAREGRDTVQDFTLAVDHLQVNSTLVGFSGAEVQLGAFVRLIPARFGGSSELQVDAHGPAGSFGWQVVAQSKISRQSTPCHCSRPVSC